MRRKSYALLFSANIIAHLAQLNDVYFEEWKFVNIFKPLCIDISNVFRIFQQQKLYSSITKYCIVLLNKYQIVRLFTRFNVKSIHFIFSHSIQKWKKYPFSLHIYQSQCVHIFPLWKIAQQKRILKSWVQ